MLHNFKNSSNDTFDTFQTLKEIGFSTEGIYKIFEDIISKYGRDPKIIGIKYYTNYDKGFSKNGNLVEGIEYPKIMIEIENCKPYFIQSIA
ncbi:hypothetical protein ACIPCA_12785 [Flavobacterium covae]|uniref:hypothetical protein n=1 Tax=Flavobacterium covae TaxID=2906076 RepID=UPI0039A58CFB